MMSSVRFFTTYAHMNLSMIILPVQAVVRVRHIKRTLQGAFTECTHIAASCK
jgi:hypothetical protein